MTPAETQLLKHLAVISHYNMVFLTITCLLYGVSILATAIALYLFLQKGVQGFARKFLLFGISILVLANTWDYICVSGLNLSQLEFWFAKQSNDGLEGNSVDATRATAPWFAQSAWPNAITLTLGDAIVSWRACAVWPGAKMIKFLLISLMLGNIIINLADCLIDDLNLPLLGSQLLSIDFAATFVSFGVNLTATLTIALKFWYHYRTTRPLYSNTKQSFSPGIRILLLLVESGALFCIAQLFIAILTVFDTHAIENSPLDIAYRVLNFVFLGMVVIYPPAIIIMLSLKQLPLQETFHLADETLHAEQRQ
ncbi:hypothetical protein BT96DRAFT_174702 [Gymnopus androsaceus JB14]|uniref:Family A G protein-coupled receptor-like protein n=1 Tax=Gymnopus androsaceus JB14 TaxID=1447944 RepID=A0A6A4IE00_9AGAR|nr:hypothetical protein BT96DRAFT_174702 [Gymnopus androsaceus JB14]